MVAIVSGGPFSEHLEVSLDNISTDYDGTTTTATSQDVLLVGYTLATFTADFSVTGTPGQITIEWEQSADGTNFAKIGNAALSSWILNPGAITNQGDRGYTFMCPGFKGRIKIDTTTTSSGNEFTVANAFLSLAVG